VRLSFSSATVQPSVTLAGYTARLPVTINIAPSLNSLPPMRVGTAFLRFEARDGPGYLRMEPTDVTLRKQNGHILLQSDVALP
jgi:hypothetical protein